MHIEFHLTFALLSLYKHNMHTKYSNPLVYKTFGAQNILDLQYAEYFKKELATTKQDQASIFLVCQAIKAQQLKIILTNAAIAPIIANLTSRFTQAF